MNSKLKIIFFCGNMLMIIEVGAEQLVLVRFERPDRIKLNVLILIFCGNRITQCARHHIQ